MLCCAWSVIGICNSAMAVAPSNQRQNVRFSIVTNSFLRVMEKDRPRAIAASRG
jgi:hypothetical protein